MALILLEALGVLAIAIFIVWWTMFSGRKEPEASSQADPPEGRGEGEGRSD